MYRPGGGLFLCNKRRGGGGGGREAAAAHFRNVTVAASAPKWTQLEVGGKSANLKKEQIISENTTLFF
jgi:hypothetical protein